MEEIVKLIATDSAAADISDKMKDMLYTKAAEKIDARKPQIALSMFDTRTLDTDTSEDQE
jgi:hypothetical protein